MAIPSGAPRSMAARHPSEEDLMGETRKYRKFTAQQKTELVLASLRGQKTIAELCREHDISETLLRRWREQFLAAGAQRLSAKAERTELDELRSQVSKLERALGRKTMEVEVAPRSGHRRGNSCGDRSEHARRPFPRVRRARPPRRPGREGRADQPAGDLPTADPTAER
ncbi:transposase [Paraconexibacter algicola]|uniref:transposase n=1 Tax=Paraconexibacter algicola TaxID=2133960 RepID=UPI00130499A6|nr:transposase [Paraconexibacter algicola]